MTPTPALIVLAALLIFTTSRTLTAETSVPPAHHHIRTTDRRLLRLVHDGARISGTFRGLIERLRHSDVVVYLECAGSGSSGRLAFVSAAGGRRYVHVRVARMLSSDQQIALLGHELRHAVEIADAPDIVDEASLARAYQRIGFLNPALATRITFDTEAAVDAGYQVLRELLGKDTAQLPTPNLQLSSASY